MSNARLSVSPISSPRNQSSEKTSTYFINKTNKNLINSSPFRDEKEIKTKTLINNPAVFLKRPQGRVRDRVMTRKFKPPKNKGKKRGGGISNYTLGDAASMAAKALSYAKYFASLINVEQKYFDVSAVTNTSSTAAVLNLSNIAEGSDYNNREGNSILLQSLYFGALITQNSSSTQSFMRIMIVRDNDQRGVDPTAADILETTASFQVLISPLLHYTNKRFSILLDKTLSFANVGDSYAQKFEFNHKFNRQHIMYQSTTGADGSNWEGGLYLLLVSSEATNTLSTVWYNRLEFTDN